MSINRKLIFRTCVVVLVTLAATVGLFNGHSNVKAAVTPGAPAPVSPSCFPSCQSNDGRFFSLAGSSLFTFAGGTTTIGMRVKGASNPANFVVGIFDGDSLGLWDQETGGNQGELVIFDLLADQDNNGVPDGPGTGTVLETLPGASMLDNAWAYFTVTTHAAARLGGAGSDYNYLLRAKLNNPGNLAGMVQNNFKVSVDSNQTAMFITPQVLSFQAFQNTFAEFAIIHPSLQPHSAANPSNYDGTWNFSFNVDPGQQAVNVWDGDFDIGNTNVNAPITSAVDTDDPTTPAVTPDDPSVSAVGFSLSGALGVSPEGLGQIGVCAGGAQNPQGCPPDNSDNDFFRRLSGTPGLGIVNTLIPPSGPSFVNNNPSGTAEWELYRVAVAGNPLPGLTDVTAALPSGIWTYRIQGMDLGNLFALRFDRILLVEPYMIGDTVFCDGNQNGTQDPGDTGVANVLVELLDSSNIVVKTTTTNASGFYSFAVEPGTYTVRIAASNFAVGGVLEGRLATTAGGNQQTKTVTNANVLTYDFGYDCTPPCTITIGDLVWEDQDGDGIKDAGEPGIGGVAVNLLFSATCNGVYVDLPGNATTNASGGYSFTGLPKGCYRVDVSTPSGYTKTTGPNPGQNNNSQSDPYDINANGEGCSDNLTADWGFQKNRTGGQGCTPGYWKQTQHFDSWVGYTPGQNFGTVFFGAGPNPASCTLCSQTLLQVVGNGGGGQDAFGRHAVAALLSASAGNVNYLYTVQNVIDLVKAAYVDGSFEAKKNLFAAQNESSCPLN